MILRWRLLSGCAGDVDVVFLVDSSESMVDLSPYGQPLYAWQQHQRFLKKVCRHSYETKIWWHEFKKIYIYLGTAGKQGIFH